MPNPTREEIVEEQLARQWAEWNKSCEVSSPEIQAAANFILAHTTPPTMAEVEWDDDKHYLAEAEHPGWGKVIMLERSACPGFIRIALAKENEPTWHAVKENTLTPTGKRYTLTEVQE